LEVNSSPGFEGIERATGLNLAATILKHIRRRAREFKAKRAPKKAVRRKPAKRGAARKRR
jgi:ribosomal protein S6--L-glutamate ligase